MCWCVISLAQTYADNYKVEANSHEYITLITQINILLLEPFHLPLLRREINRQKQDNGDLSTELARSRAAQQSVS